MSEPVVVNPSPKQRFQQDGNSLKAHLNLISRPEFERALDVALREYQFHLTRANGSLNDAAACHFKSCGAVEFIDVLMKLAHQYQAPIRKPEGQLIQKP